MAAEIPPKLRIKAALAAVAINAQSAVDAVDRDNIRSFGRWVKNLYEAMEGLGPEVQKYIAHVNSPPASLEERLKKGTGN